MGPTRWYPLTIPILILYTIGVTWAEVLTPPYFNLAEERRIEATATCGEGVTDPEVYCKLVGANADGEASTDSIKGGQWCDTCDPRHPDKMHPAQFAIDGSEKHWQSPPLSRGMDYNRVNLTIDLGQLFQVAYVLIKMGNSPRPGIWVLERSVDNGLSYTPWQYFADSPSDCAIHFGEDSLRGITEDDDVICVTQFSKVVPLEGGEIVVSLLNDRPSANSFFNSSVLQEFTRATNVRLRLIRTKTLLGHLMSVARRDPTVTRRYFYSIKDISIGGRCVCNGHADVCDLIDPNDKYKLQCRCQHNTCGSQCEMCCPGFIQKKWRPAGYHQYFECEPCNCYGHTEECVYDAEVDASSLSRDIYGNFEGGGRCLNCRDNTEGINCDQCISGYYRPYDRNLNDTDVCQPCNCNFYYSTGNCEDGSGRCECKPAYLPPNCDACNIGYYDYPDCKPCDCHRMGTQNQVCEVGGGQCPCYDNYQGLNCDQCAPSYFNFPECLSCNCSDLGSQDDLNMCDAETGQCKCQNEFGGRTCDQCKHGYYNYPDCQYCNCDSHGTTEEICDKNNGTCLCKEGYDGPLCDTNKPGYYLYPDATPCGCHKRGASSNFCSRIGQAIGQCPCLEGFSGRACDQCSPGYFNFPECTPCNCDPAGSNGISCDIQGRCQCKDNFSGIKCDQCQEGYYNFPRCEECNCNPAGVLETFGGCGDAPVGELCQCKDRVTGRICDRCRALFWNLRPENPLGCDECGCHLPGTLGGLATCDTHTGQCQCKPGVNSRQCDRCRDGTFALREDNLFGCSDCGCSVGGSVDNVCDKESGQCRCRPRVTGQRCDEPLQLHYFPTLYQLKYEAEDGLTPQNTPVRFGYNEEVFPGYSWRGYAVFSDIQREIIQEVYIEKPSIYRMVVAYHNPASKTIVGRIRITPDDPADSEQEVEVHFTPTNGPRLMTVEAVPGNFPVPLVMNPGRWAVSFENSQNLFLDYFVLLPLAYYEGTVLTKNTSTPCMVRGGADLCLHYAYPDVFQYDYIYGSAGYRSYGEERLDVELYDDYEVLELLNTQPMAYLNHNQDTVQYEIMLKKPGRHVLLINYFTPESTTTTNVVVEASTRKGMEKGRAILYDCQFSTVCRQVVTDLSGRVGVFHFDSNFVSLAVQGETNTNIAIDSIIAVPYKQWHQDLVRPQRFCTRENGECVQTFYPTPPDSTKFEFESNLEGKYAATVPEGVYNESTLVYLNHSDPMVDITGKLSRPGQYVFVVHYLQPTYPEFEVDVLLQNGQFYEGSLEVNHCASTSGCRSLITHAAGNYVFDIQENFVLSLKEPNHKSLWVDYVLVIPYQQYDPAILHELPVDRTAQFINHCGHDNFNLNANDTGFCRDAAFEVTSEYNNGALPCKCDFYGSSSFECDKFGGQCPCRPNIIGRRCNLCKTGYYGFPECRPCSCPSTALCDTITGECICPPRVEGERCDRCAAYTYGFDPIIGCEECVCSPLGVRAGNLQCDLQSGQCDCKDAVVGRRCERCAAGYWSFPFCQLCECDLRGTEADICNQENAVCYCKQNVQGRACDSCAAGSYNLEETNPFGCTKCFCFGKTEYCSSADVHWEEILEDDMSEWSTVIAEQIEEQQHSGFSYPSLSLATLATQPHHYEGIIQQDLEGAEEYLPEGQVFFSAPFRYIGNRVMSYGGFLRYTLVFIRDGEGTELRGPDVVLTGGNIIAHYYSSFNPETLGEFNNEVRLTEHNFRKPSGLSMEREEFMMLLYKLDSVLIRANYWTKSIEARLSNVSMDVPSSQWNIRNPRAALSVELCQCPVNYKGSSCEDCADGYYRAQRGPYGGYCIPCQCNGHSDTCDPNTGRCLNCRHNTVGDHCELCAQGYHGLATKGTPYDCLICACPLPSITNNFALSCDFLDDGYSIQCDCQPGYVGDRCQRCAPGYYGEPEVLEDFCRPCECNENIDPYDVYGCDDITGRCLNCLNNTYGESCDRCAPGYYGDAVVLKNCDRCSCDECGTRNCEHYSGDCECFENVVGRECDQCAPDHWGFESCQGCQPCQCGIASYSSQCDEGTGQCSCQDGVTGQRCDQCKPGYWNYTSYGCQDCLCREGFSVGVGCDPRTGQCQCLPGVVGANCDRCPYRWVLRDGYGCQECGPCVHSLLDTTDDLATILQGTIDEFETAAYNYFLHQRLGVINNTVNELRPAVDLMDVSEDQTLTLATPLQVILEESQVMASASDLVGQRANDAARDGLEIHQEALKVMEDVDAAYDLARDIVAEINRLVIGLETGTGAQLEQAINEAEAILVEMNEREFGPFADKAETEQELAKELLETVKNSFLPLKDQQNITKSHEDRLQELGVKLEEMKEHIFKAQEETMNAKRKIHNNEAVKLRSVTSKVDLIKEMSGNVDDSVKDSKELLALARENNDNVTTNLDMLVLSVESLRGEKIRLNETVLNNVDGLMEAQDIVQDIPAHVYELQITAERLDGMLGDTRQVAENALAAANAYENIVMAIDDAYNASLLANMSASQAVRMSYGVSDQALESQEASEEKHQLAEMSMQRVDLELKPQLERAQEDVAALRDMNRVVESTLNVIDGGLDQLNHVEFSEKAERLKESAIEAEASGEQAIEQVNNVENLLGEAQTTAQLLNKNIVDGNRFINQANELVTEVEQKISEMSETAYTLQQKKTVIQGIGIDVGERLQKLRNYIKQTRELTNRIKVGVSFQPSTTIELENPADLTKAATSTKVSLFARTEEPSGLLMFLGTPKGGSEQIRRTTSDDFMAIEVDGGYVRLTMDLGAGPHSIEYNNLFIADGEWTKIMVERTGKVVRLSVEREGMELEPIEQVMPGRMSVFNLDPRVSKIYVGGIPPGVGVHDAIASTSFIGALEDLRINDQPLGLWNFMQNGTIDNRQRGAMARDKLVNLVPPTGLRFGGEGYAAFNTTGFRFQRTFDLNLDFKTYAEDGILFIITSTPNQYMSLALEEGHLIFQYNLGSGFATMRSQGTFHDGNWHHVEVARQNNNGILKVGTEQITGQSGGDRRRMAHVGTMFFGGFPGEHEFGEVTNEDFHGCIDNVVVSSVSLDLSKSKETLGTVPGCPIQVASLVSFEQSSPGYVQLSPPEGSGLQLVFKFKTDRPDGLLVYASTREQDSYVSLSLAEGALILRAAPGGELTTGSYDKYNDSEWHVVIASREHNELRLDIDDFKSHRARVGEEAIPFNGPVFFGGVPEIFKIQAAASATDTNFYGCLGDATLNGRIVNFAETEESVGAHLEKCPLERESTVIFNRGLGSNTTTETPIVVVYPDNDYDDTQTQPRPQPPYYEPTTTIAPISERFPSTTEGIFLDSCVLPEIPAPEQIDSTLGNRFGSKLVSRIEFFNLPGTARADFKFSLEFRTEKNDSLIFYASDSGHRDFIAIYIKDGKVVFSFNPGGNTVLMRTQESFNNGMWHSIIAQREGDVGLLYVDGYKKDNSTVTGDSRFLDLQSPYYYGGVDPDKTEMVRMNTEEVDSSFGGCLRQLRMNNNRLSGQHKAYAVVPCSNNIEQGIFFRPGNRSHVILLKRFIVGRVFEMTMDIKPRKNNGVIASVHGRRDYVLLEIRNGTIKLSVDNGKGAMIVEHIPPSPWSFCDGQWHSIKLIKNKNIAILVVDDFTSTPATGKVGATSTDTRNPLFLGSQPFLDNRRGEATLEKYVGCIRDVTVNKEVINLSEATFAGAVDAGACPTN